MNEAQTIETAPEHSARLSTADAVRRAQQGDSEAFEHLYRMYGRRVYALCLRMTGNRYDAEDLTQEVFLQVFRKIHTFRCESAFTTWLHRVSVNIVLMSRRRRKVVEVELEEENEAD